ncbi:phage adaptor protein [Rhizobium mongolense]|uniref:Uncharacterized protein n=2 Tax=Rhizobium mongolense TaxID=57676 RepID=A0ABR6IR89_9HYPH|nr:hypothetical protein [Rhizobium mongolense]MBB4230029.1 hypothetical protein [Rhizobium mongolense]TVZ72839.1 hypothetical protein BCL32_1026 [Rhizobium mongolense USDA 1844]
MAIQNYSDLITAIDSFTVNAGAPADLCVALAEEALRPLLKHRLMEEKVTTNVSAGQSPELPADFQEARAILLDGERIRPLSFQNDNLARCDLGYVVTGNTIEIRPVPSTDYVVELYYYQRLPSLSVSNPTNWLITNFPTVYLRASLAQAYHWLKDFDAEQAEKDLTSDALSAVVRDHTRSTMYGNTIIEELSSW